MAVLFTVRRMDGNSLCEIYVRSAYVVPAEGANRDTYRI